MDYEIIRYRQYSGKHGHRDGDRKADDRQTDRSTDRSGCSQNYRLLSLSPSTLPCDPASSFLPLAQALSSFPHSLISLRATSDMREPTFVPLLEAHRSGQGGEQIRWCARTDSDRVGLGSDHATPPGGADGPSQRPTEPGYPYTCIHTYIHTHIDR